MSSCSLSKCLVCFVKVEPQFIPLEPPIHFPSEIEGFENNDDNITNIELSSSSPPPPPSRQSQFSLKKQLDVIFLFKRVLQLPNKQLERYLEIRGNPEGWAVLCTTCEAQVNKLKEIFEELQKISRKFEYGRRKIEKRIKITSFYSGHEGTEEGSSKINDDADIILDECRRIVSKRKAAKISKSSKLESQLKGDRRAQQLAVNLEKRKKLKTELELDGDEEHMEYELSPFPFDLMQEDEAEDPLEALHQFVENENSRYSEDAETFRPGPNSNAPSGSEGDFEVDERGNFSASSGARSSPIAKSKAPREGRRTVKAKKSVPVANVDDSDSNPPTVLKRGSKKGSKRTTIDRLFPCSICPRRIARNNADMTFSNLLNHIYRYHRMTYKCKACSKCFPALVDQHILEHYYRHHKDANNCGLTMDDRVEKVQEPPELPVIPWWCPVCKMEFKGEGLRDAHINKIHGNSSSSELERKIQCGFCPATYFTEDEQDAHVLLHHPDQFKKTPNECDQCHMCFGTDRRLRLHRIQKHNLDLYTCDQCGAQFKSDTAFDTHMKFKHGDSKDLEKVTCTQCNKTFANESVLKAHVKKKHEGAEELPCEVCAKMFKSKSGLKLHMYVYHGILIYGQVPKSYNCTVEGCSEVFFNVHYFKQHLEQHQSVVKPTCSICQKEFNVQHLLDRHEFFVHKIVKESTKNLSYYDCPKCGKRCVHPKALKAHSLACGRSFAAAVECDMCNVKCSSRNDLRNHKIFKHGIPPEQLGPEEEEHAAPEVELHLCADCGKSFKLKERLTNHINTFHLKLGLSSCDLCPRQFYSPAVLEYHKAKEHNIGVENFLCVLCNTFCTNKSQKKRHVCGVDDKVKNVCNQCGFECYNSSNLKKHIARVHDREVKYQCEHCSYSTISSDAYNVHKARHHGEGIKCEVEGCGKVLGSKGWLLKHMKRAHPKDGEVRERSFLCTECGKGFYEKDSLRDHIQSMHTNRESKPYKCRICGKGFATLNYRSRHMRGHKKRGVVEPVEDDKKFETYSNAFGGASIPGLDC